MKTGVAYFGNRMADHFVERDLPEIVRSGCSYIVHTFSENDFYFYRGTLRAMVTAGRNAGLESFVDPWGVGGIFGGEAFSQFVARYPEARQIKADGDPIPAACPNNPEFQAFIDEWMEAVITLAPDAVFWDDPHLYLPQGPIGEQAEWTCHCSHCRNQFLQKYGRPLPQRLTSEVVEFREDTLVELIRTGSATLKANGIKSAVGLLPFEDPEHGIVHWEKLASLPSLEILAVSPFWQLFKKDRDSFVGYWARKLANLCGTYGKEPMVWLQAFLIEEEQEEELTNAAEIAYKAGIRNMAAWGYRGCAHMSAISCTRPDVAWAILGKTFRALRVRG